VTIQRKYFRIYLTHNEGFVQGRGKMGLKKNWQVFFKKPEASPHLSWLAIITQRVTFSKTRQTLDTLYGYFEKQVEKFLYRDMRWADKCHSPYIHLHPCTNPEKFY
jgi:hypothetical protein